MMKKVTGSWPAVVAQLTESLMNLLKFACSSLAIAGTKVKMIKSCRVVAINGSAN
jgi:hypothetical protein